MPGVAGRVAAVAGAVSGVAGRVVAVAGEVPGVAGRVVAVALAVPGVAGRVATVAGEVLGVSCTGRSTRAESPFTFRCTKGTIMAEEPGDDFKSLQ